MSGFSKGSSSTVVASYQFGSQTANIASTAVSYWGSTNYNAAGLYRFSYELEVTTVGAAGSTLPGLVITAYNRQNQQLSTTTATSTGNTLTTFTSGTLIFDVRAGSSNDVTYATTGYASPTAGMQYSLRFVVEYLGNV